MRVILKVNPATWDDIVSRVVAAGQGDRVDATRRHVDVHEIVLEPALDEATPLTKRPIHLPERMLNQ